jgi:hypothetical protein
MMRNEVLVDLLSGMLLEYPKIPRLNGRTDLHHSDKRLFWISKLSLSTGCNDLLVVHQTVRTIGQPDPTQHHPSDSR